MTSEEKGIYWRKYARQNAKYERNGVVVFRRTIADLVLPVALHAEKYGAQSALDSLDSLVKRQTIERSFIEFYLYVGYTHKQWTDQDLRIRIERKKRGAPPVAPSLVAVDPADAGFGAGFFNAPWLQRLKRLVYSLQAAKRVTSISNTIKKKLRGVLGRVIKEEVRPSVMAARITSEMGGKFSEARARLIARTESTFIANVAAKESAMETMALGIELVKVWIDTRDSRVRDTHWNIPDPIDFYEKFKIGDKLMDKPGDPDGGAEECCNCRCCVAYLPKDDYEDIFPKQPKLSDFQK
jgi:hypothetical protein